jgi:hypothetical protein
MDKRRSGSLSIHLVVRWTGNGPFPTDQYVHVLNSINALCGGNPIAGGIEEQIEFHNGWNIMLKLKNENVMQRVLGALRMSFEGRMEVFLINPCGVTNIPL